MNKFVKSVTQLTKTFQISVQAQLRRRIVGAGFKSESRPRINFKTQFDKTQHEHGVHFQPSFRGTVGFCKYNPGVPELLHRYSF